MNETITRDQLILEYLKITQSQQEQFTRIINTYSSSVTSLNGNIRMLLQRHVENESNYINNLMGYRQLSSGLNLPNRFVTQPRTTRSNVRAHTLPRRRRGTEYWVREAAQPPTTPIRDNLSSRTPSTRYTTTNFSFANSLNNRLNNILQTTLYTPQRYTPLSNTDISNNTTIRIRNQIESSQEICPISLAPFLPSDRVMQINTCGHIFLESSLTTLLQDYDNRCPLCRVAISPSATTTSQTTSTTSTNTSPNLNYSPPQPHLEIPQQSAPHLTENTPLLSSNPLITSTTLPSRNNNDPIFDVSLNYISNLNSNNTPSEINNLINTLSSSILSSLSSAIQNPDNSGNTISAEYSVVFPRNNT